MSVSPVTLAEMRSIDLFEDLDDEQLEVWRAAAVPEAIKPGVALSEADEEPRGMILLLEGRLEVLSRSGTSADSFGIQEAPTWSLAIATMTSGTASVKMRSLTDCRVAWIEKDDFLGLAFDFRSVHDRVMKQMAPVYQRMAEFELSRDRMASLGTMSAGLAHELNNPAAASQRASEQLEEALETISSSLAGFVEAGIEREQAGHLVELQQQAYNQAGERCSVSALAAADAEDALQDRLEDLGVERAWELSGPLSDAGVDDEWIDRVAELAGPATGIALHWIAATLTARVLVDDVQKSTGQISDLVGAIKDYSFMDRGALAVADIHQGINSTVKILGHKLKHTNIEIVREYGEGIPEMQVRGSELNQVWTNILDNAIGALGNDGTITIRTSADSSCIQVDITDDGPGIPDEVKGRIFDSFFTTKGVGEGTGLGLSTAHRIITEGHKGSLWVDSEPGNTTFHVRMPFDQS